MGLKANTRTALGSSSSPRQHKAEPLAELGRGGGEHVSTGIAQRRNGRRGAEIRGGATRTEQVVPATGWRSLQGCGRISHERQAVFTALSWPTWHPTGGRLRHTPWRRDSSHWTQQPAASEGLGRLRSRPPSHGRPPPPSPPGRACSSCAPSKPLRGESQKRANETRAWEVSHHSPSEELGKKRWGQEIATGDCNTLLIFLLSAPSLAARSIKSAPLSRFLHSVLVSPTSLPDK